MKNTIETRELIVLDGLIRGTYHKPPDYGLGARSNLTERGRIGVLFLNSLSPTRAAHGDSAIYWANAFAERGYPSFRLDLPGFGDSGGDTPTKLLGYIERGGYASISAAKVSELVARYNLSGIVIVGHCAGAVSAVYTAAASKKCRGLVLLDPYFQLSDSIQPKARRQRLLGVPQCHRSGRFGNILNTLKEICLSLRNSPPENANFLLLRRWKELASTGLPVLILNAPGRKTLSTEPKVGEFDYFKYVLALAGSGSQVVSKLMGEADRSFVSRLGRTAVRRHIENWLNMYFPLIPYEDSDVNVMRTGSSNSEIDFEDREQRLEA